MKMRTLLVIMLLSLTLSFVSAQDQEKPYMLYVSLGGGIAGQYHEQYSPLALYGPSLRIEGGWAIRNDFFLWNGQLSYNTETLSSSSGMGFEVESEMLGIQTSVVALLPVMPFKTTFGLGVSMDCVGLFTENFYKYEIDVYNALFAFLGPSLFAENKMLDRWTFRLQCSVPLAGIQWSPVWVNGSGGINKTTLIVIPDFLYVDGRLSALLRLSNRTELLCMYTCIIESHKKPFDSRLFNNFLSLGLEIDLGATK